MKLSKKMFFTASAVLLFSTTACTIKQTPSSTRTVSVSGSGQVELDCDQAEIVLSVITRSSDVNAATKDNSAKMTKVQQAIAALGIANDAIVTSDFSIRQDQSSSNGRIIYGAYNVSNKITVYIKDLSLAGQVIDTAVKNGANSLTSLDFTSSKKEDGIKEARLLAIKHAQESATLLVTSSGAKLGKILSIEESPSRMFAKTARYAMEEASMATPIAPDKQVVTVTVNATYQID